MKKYIGLEGMPSCDASIGDMQKFERKRSMRYKVHMYPITELECMTVSQRHSSPAAHTCSLLADPRAHRKQQILVIRNRPF